MNTIPLLYQEILTKCNQCNSSRCDYKPQTSQQIQSQSQFDNLPIPLHMISSKSSLLNQANIVLITNFSAFKHSALYTRLLKDHIILIDCYSQTDEHFVSSKLIDMLIDHQIKSIKIATDFSPFKHYMIDEVQRALSITDQLIPVRTYRLSLNGSVT